METPGPAPEPPAAPSSADGATPQQLSASDQSATPPDATPPTAAEPAAVRPQRTTGGGLFAALAVYTLLRVVLVVALTAVLMIFMPLIVALMFAIVVQLPLAWLLFGRWRARLNDEIARASAHRRAERDRLQSALTGEPNG